MDNPFLKRLMKDKKEDIVHSSAYASAQNQGIGSASTSTFSERQKIEHNRTTIQSYRDAKIVRESLSNGPKAKTITEAKQDDLAPATLKQRLDGSSTVASADSHSQASTRDYSLNIKPDIKPKF